jgi:hypothetical protein
MVLTVERKIISIIFLFCLNIIPIFGQGWTPESGLVQYGENIDRGRLELLEDKQLIHFFRKDESMVTGTYTIRNSGDEYKTTIGILFQELQGGPNPDILNLQFFVDNEKVNYYKINNYASVNLGEKIIELPQISTCWALVDVTFPKNSIVTVKVQHTGIYSSYNHPSLEYFPKLLYWKGPTKFSVEVINEDKNRDKVEFCWISNIAFASTTYTAYGQRHELNTNEYLQTLQDMDKSIIEIKRKNGNTFLIEFKEDFYNKYPRNIMLKWRDWMNGIYSYIFFDGEENNEYSILLNFPEKNGDITKRLLGPYELIFLTNNQLRVMRNAFYARHGYTFKTEDMKAMFENFSVNIQYQKNPNFHEGMLTDIDRANIETIKKLETLTEN